MFKILLQPDRQWNVSVIMVSQSLFYLFIANAAELHLHYAQSFHLFVNYITQFLLKSVRWNIWYYIHDVQLDQNYILKGLHPRALMASKTLLDP